LAAVCRRAGQRGGPDAPASRVSLRQRLMGRPERFDPKWRLLPCAPNGVDAAWLCPYPVAGHRRSRQAFQACSLPASVPADPRISPQAAFQAEHSRTTH
jgi:hypothetical protein